MSNPGGIRLATRDYRYDGRLGPAMKSFPLRAGGDLSPLDLPPPPSHEEDLKAYLQETIRIHAAGQGDHNIAAHRYAAVLRDDPDNAVALSCLAHLMTLAGHREVAVQMARRAVELAPGTIGPLLNLGISLLNRGQKGDFEDARKLLEFVCRQDPKIFVASYRLGLCYDFLGDHVKAIARYSKAIEIDPSNKGPYLDRAMAMMRLGRWADGLKEFEVRWDTIGKPQISQKVPEWKGEPLDGKRIAMMREQGAGDTIQCSRFAMHLEKRGADVYLGVSKSLMRLIEQRLPGSGILPPKVWDSDGAETPEVDYWTSGFESFRWLGMESNQIYGKPYLTQICGKPYLTEIGNERPFDLAMPDDKLRVGIAWLGAAANPSDRRRSASLEAFMALSRVPGIALASLQVGGSEEIERIGADALLWDAAPLISDYEDTARILSKLDLVISVDTSVAHLAGAMGVPCWMLVDYMSDWRWAWSGDTTPWYDSIRIFRKHQPGNFDEVLFRVCAALRLAVGTPRSLEPKLNRKMRRAMAVTSVQYSI